MKTGTLSDTELERADELAVMQKLLHGTPLDPEVAKRVQARADAITERIRQTHGETIDVDQLIHDARDE